MNILPTIRKKESQFIDLTHLVEANRKLGVPEASPAPSTGPQEVSDTQYMELGWGTGVNPQILADLREYSGAIKDGHISWEASPSRKKVVRSEDPIEISSEMAPYFYFNGSASVKRIYENQSC